MKPAGSLDARERLPVVAAMIDTARLQEVIKVLDRQRPADNHVWARQSAVEATCMIVFTENLGRSAGPDRRRPGSPRSG
ncbi:hypothetical protein [Nonomuraea typhae]|uniref:Uncharacterized protein n=1 Tax=Nonomuraea typhae TaxID=2603600 RepID=A0ABW7Z4Z1_9ACTN